MSDLELRIENQRLRDKKYRHWPALVEISPGHYDWLIAEIRRLDAENQQLCKDSLEEK